MRAQILKQETRYNVQIMETVDGKEYYTGNGKYFDDLADAEVYANRINHKRSYDNLSKAAKKTAIDNYINEYGAYEDLSNVPKCDLVYSIRESEIRFTETGEII